jgi:hypothetical protein
MSICFNLASVVTYNRLIGERVRQTIRSIFSYSDALVMYGRAQKSTVANIDFDVAHSEENIFNWMEYLPQDCIETMIRPLARLGQHHFICARRKTTDKSSLSFVTHVCGCKVDRKRFILQE